MCSKMQRLGNQVGVRLRRSWVIVLRILTFIVCVYKGATEGMNMGRHACSCLKEDDCYSGFPGETLQPCKKFVLVYFEASINLSQS